MKGVIDVKNKVTLPCHMSMFHSIVPRIHGTTTNTYMPQVRPVNGLLEQLNKADKVSAMFYGSQFVPGKKLSGVSIFDTAPTIADIMSANPAKEWEGKSLLGDENV